MFDRSKCRKKRAITAVMKQQPKKTFRTKIAFKWSSHLTEYENKANVLHMIWLPLFWIVCFCCYFWCVYVCFFYSILLLQWGSFRLTNFFYCFVLVHTHTHTHPYEYAAAAPLESNLINSGITSTFLERSLDKRTNIYDIATCSHGQ